MSEKPRKGARRISEISQEILGQLNSGILETASLPELLAIDFGLLARSIGLKSLDPPEGGIVQKMQQMGVSLKDWERHATHRSDTVRGWACYALARDSRLGFAEKLDQMKRFAADPHFGVREWAWMAIRPQIALNLKEAIEHLAEWTSSPQVGLRRFASESTRPRGVWCSHIEALKKDPALGLPILDPLQADPEKYVQDSVGNWLNDAAKSSRDWVEKLCGKWEGRQNSFTDKIVKRALRNFRKEDRGT